MRKIPGDLLVLAIAVAVGLGLSLLLRHHSANSRSMHQPLAAQAAQPIKKP
jgi:hypothetical protein